MSGVFTRAKVEVSVALVQDKFPLRTIVRYSDEIGVCVTLCVAYYALVYVLCTL